MLILLIFGFFAFWMSVLTLFSFLQDRIALKSRLQANSSLYGNGTLIVDGNLSANRKLDLDSSLEATSSPSTKTNLKEEKIVSLLAKPSIETSPSIPQVRASEPSEALEPSMPAQKRSEWTQAFQDLWSEISKGA